MRFNRQSITARVTEKVPREEAAVKHIFLHIPQIIEWEGGGWCNAPRL